MRGRHSAPGRSVPPGLRAADVVAANPGVTGSNLVLARSAWQRVGGFDEDLPVANDQDLFLRLLDAGVTYAVVPLRLVDKHLHDAPRIASPSPARKEGLARFAAKHAARQTPRDRRHLRAELVREAVRTASPVRRLLAGLHFSCCSVRSSCALAPGERAPPFPGAPAAAPADEAVVLVAVTHWDVVLAQVVDPGSGLVVPGGHQLGELPQLQPRHQHGGCQCQRPRPRPPHGRSRQAPSRGTTGLTPE